jgi:hypothetical protein
MRSHYSVNSSGSGKRKFNHVIRDPASWVHRDSAPGHRWQCLRSWFPTPPVDDSEAKRRLERPTSRLFRGVFHVILDVGCSIFYALGKVFNGIAHSIADVANLIPRGRFAFAVAHSGQDESQ